MVETNIIKAALFQFCTNVCSFIALF